MKLNKSQKQFMFEHGYADARVLDAAIEPGWMNYFIRNFDWKLEDIQQREVGTRQYYGQLKLYSREYKEVWYNYGVIFQDNDYFKLLKLGAK